MSGTIGGRAARPLQKEDILEALSGGSGAASRTLTPVPVGDDAVAINAAIAAFPAGGGCLDLQPGTYVLYSQITVTNKSIIIRGVGEGPVLLVQAHSGFGMVISQDALDKTVSLSNFRVVSVASTAIPLFLSISYTQVVASYARSSVYITNVSILSGSGGTAANSFSKGIAMANCWSPKIENYMFVGRYASPSIANTCAIDLTECFDVWIVNSSIHYGEAMVRQYGYCEGIRIIHPTAVGCDWLVTQDVSGIVKRATFNLNGLWITGGEINTQRGGLKLAAVTTIVGANNHWSRWGDSGSTYIVYDYTDVTQSVHMGDNCTGGLTTATSTYAKCQKASGNCAINRWIGSLVQNTGKAADFGVNTELNDLVDVMSVNGVVVQNFTDAGVRNRITFRDQQGDDGKVGNRIFKGAGGQSLFVIADVADAANIIQVVPTPAGGTPYFNIGGPDTNIGLTVVTKGQSGFVLNHSGGTSLVVSPQSATSANYPLLRSAASGNAVVYGTEGADANINLIISPKGSGGVYFGTKLTSYGAADSAGSGFRTVRVPN